MIIYAMDYLRYGLLTLCYRLFTLWIIYTLLWIIYGLFTLRIIYLMDLLVSSSQEWVLPETLLVGRDIIFIVSHTCISSVLHNSLLILVMSIFFCNAWCLHSSFIIWSNLNILCFLPTCIYRERWPHLRRR